MSAILEERAPDKVGSRELARELFAAYRDQLEDSVVRLDCRTLRVATPSFADELVLEILVRARARCLILDAPPERMVMYAERSANLRGVSDRLSIENLG